MRLSIIIPVFNEEKSIQEVLQKVINVEFTKVEKEIIVINDGSSDKTGEKIKDFIKKNKKKGIYFFEHKVNSGKGAAVKTGIKKATGDYIVIQDADTEYNPQDIVRLFDPILRNQADVVYGTRLNRMPNLLKEEKNSLFLLHYFGNRFLSVITSALYGKWITDMETCYKIFPRSTALSFNLSAKGFEFEPEITAKLLKKKLRFMELPITTKPRGHAEGKKLNTFHDGPIALWTLLKFRFFD